MQPEDTMMSGWYREQTSAVRERTSHALDRLAVDKQVADRVPGLAAGVHRGGRLVWFAGVGSADLDYPEKAPCADTQFDIASITKTFVAVTVMALRDAGKLSLDDPLERHIPQSRHGGVTVRQALAHVSGMQREPVGDVWDTLRFPDREELLRGWNAAERVGRPHQLHHYSNLCFGLLGELIARVEKQDWDAVVRRRVLDPLGLHATSLGRIGGLPQAGRYYLPPWTDVPVTEPAVDLLAFAPAGGFASTARDLGLWGGFLASPTDEVLAADTLEEMCQPIVTAAPDWSLAWGLGLMLLRHDGRVWVGHTGAFPGTISGCFTHRESGTTGVVLMNQSTATAPGTFAAGLGSYVLEHDPELPPVWRPGTTTPAELEPLLGQWFSEGSEFTFSVREGRLEARLRSAPATTAPSLFEAIGPDLYVTTAGRERGELLRIRRDESGAVTAMNWATYLFTRRPFAFGEWL